MQDLLITGMPKTVEADELAGNQSNHRKPVNRRPKMIVCSAVPGRGRWYVEILEDNPRLAAAVELVLRGEDGIEDAKANPLTGRVLVQYRPDLPVEDIAALITRAIEFGPMSREEFSAFHSNHSASFSARHFLMAELGCSALNMVFLGGCCPAVLVTAGVLFLLHRRA